MTELERWMNDNPPLADALTAEETAALRQKVLARRPRLHALRGWRVMATAAALCLVAAGAVVLGLFHPGSILTTGVYFSRFSVGSKTFVTAFLY